jgi:hypothetical protein
MGNKNWERVCKDQFEETVVYRMLADWKGTVSECRMHEECERAVFRIYSIWEARGI